MSEFLVSLSICNWIKQKLFVGIYGKFFRLDMLLSFLLFLFQQGLNSTIGKCVLFYCICTKIALHYLLTFHSYCSSNFPILCKNCLLGNAYWYICIYCSANHRSTVRRIEMLPQIVFKFRYIFPT